MPNRLGSLGQTALPSWRKSRPKWCVGEHSSPQPPGSYSPSVTGRTPRSTRCLQCRIRGGLLFATPVTPSGGKRRSKKESGTEDIVRRDRCCPWHKRSLCHEKQPPLEGSYLLLVSRVPILPRATHGGYKLCLSHSSWSVTEKKLLLCPPISCLC